MTNKRVVSGTQILAYEDIRQVMDRAVDSATGVKVTFPSRNMATNFRHRCHKFRVLMQRLNSQSKTEDDPDYGSSTYDSLIISIEADPRIVMIRHRMLVTYDVEELTENEALLAISTPDDEHQG